MTQAEKQVKKTQRRLSPSILKKHGSISSWEARIYQLRRDGCQIRTVAQAHWHSQTGNCGSHAVYHLVEAV